MYSNKLAVAIKANGQILREFGETTYIPFGTEYTILIKNLNSVRVQVRVSIDDKDVTGGTSLVINSNSEVELERSITDGNLLKGNRFKFIERTSDIEAHKGISISDGLVRIEYEFERMITSPSVQLTDYTDLWKKPYSYREPTWTSTSMRNDVHRINTLRSVGPYYRGGDYGTTYAMSAPTGSVGDVALQGSVTYNDVGITVPGSVSNQQFQTVGSFPVETTTHTIVLKLLGKTDAGKRVQEPMTVKTKAPCQTCGKVNKVTAKFCSNCGTSLEIV